MISNNLNYRTSNIINPPIVDFKKRLTKLCARERLIDLTQAVPSYPMPGKIKEELKQDFSDSFSYYTPDQGIPELRVEICKLHSIAGVSLTPSNVIVTAGANQGAFSIFTALFNPGDKVALPLPYYFNYDMALRMLGVEAYYYKLYEEDQFKLSVDKLGEGVFKECRAIIVINPNNPTGAEYSVNELKTLYNKCKNNGLKLIMDETYGFFARDGYPRSSLLSHVKELDSLILINTFSKTFSLTGFRVGYVIGSEGLINEVLKVQDTVVICAPHISQVAALIGLKSCGEWLNEKISFINSNAREFARLFNEELKRFKLLSCGNFFAYVRHPFENMNSVEAAALIAQKVGIMVLPGEIFDPGGTDFLRLAFGNLSSSDEMNQVIERFSTIENSF